MNLERTKLFAYLEALGIASETVEHEAMFTVEHSQALRSTIPGAHTKNLFLRDKENRLVLVVVKEDATVDLKGLSKRLGLGRFSFGKPEQMQSVLGIEPGSVTANGAHARWLHCTYRRGRGRGTDRLCRGQLSSVGQPCHHAAGDG